MESVIKIGIGVIVIKDGKVLLGKRKNSHSPGTYAPPGGHLELYETVEACARRELEEETSLKIVSFDVGPWTEDVIDSQKHYISFYVIVHAFEGEPILLEPHKCEGWEWFSWDDLPSPLFPPLQTFLTQYHPEKMKI